MTGGKADAKEEFVELFNASDTAVNLLKWKLLYKSSSGKNETELLSFNENLVLAPGEYFVAGSDEFLGKKNGKLKDNLSGTSGAIGLRNDKNALVESIAYGKVNSENNFIEKAPCEAPTKGNSMSRVPDGKDTDNNFFDFVKTKVITPAEGNKPIISSAFEFGESDGIIFIQHFNNNFEIKFEDASTHKEIIIFDNFGRCLFGEEKNNVELDLSKYAPGIYFVNIITEQKKIIKKVFIK